MCVCCARTKSMKVWIDCNVLCSNPLAMAVKTTLFCQLTQWGSCRWEFTKPDMICYLILPGQSWRYGLHSKDLKWANGEWYPYHWAAMILQSIQTGQVKQSIASAQWHLSHSFSINTGCIASLINRRIMMMIGHGYQIRRSAALARVRNVWEDRSDKPKVIILIW